MRLLIVTGLSGAGKSKAVDVLEDLRYFCADNLPPRLALTFAKLLANAAEPYEKAAAVMDARAGGTFSEVFSSLDELRAAGFAYELLFLDASDEVLARRFKETRREHPLCGQHVGMGLPEAIAAERALLEPLRARADFTLDTTDLSPALLREHMVRLFAASANAALQIRIHSFGFSHGSPRDSDLLFDVRCLPNPFYEAHLKGKTGMEQPVEDYIFSFPESVTLFEKMMDMLLFLLPLYQREGKSALVISVGCTGGKHRSVLFARRIGEELEARQYCVHVSHRDI